MSIKEFIKKVIGEKKKYRDMMARVKALPEDYQFVYEKIRHYMWSFGAGDGYDMMDIHYDLIELFEAGTAEGKSVLEVTGEDVAAFCDELLRNTKTYTEKWRTDLNKDVAKRFGK